MHCHLEVHTSWGLKMAWLVLDGRLPNQKLLPPPSDLPKCWFSYLFRMLKYYLFEFFFFSLSFFFLICCLFVFYENWGGWSVPVLQNWLDLLFLLNWNLYNYTSKSLWWSFVNCNVSWVLINKVIMFFLLHWYEVIFFFQSWSFVTLFYVSYLYLNVKFVIYNIYYYWNN